MVVPTASIVFQVAGIVMLVGVVVRLARAYRDRESTSRSVSPLERAQAVAITIATIGLALFPLADSGVAGDLVVAGTLAALAIAVVRRRRNEPSFPPWL